MALLAVAAVEQWPVPVVRSRPRRSLAGLAATAAETVLGEQQPGNSRAYRIEVRRCSKAGTGNEKVGARTSRAKTGF